MEEAQNKDYFVFLLSKVKADLCRNRDGIDLDKVCGLLNSFEKSDNLERDILLLTRVEGLESLGSYLLFVLKKIESGAVSFENVTQNLYRDANFIRKNLIENLKVKKLTEEIIEEVEQEKDSLEEDKTSSVIEKPTKQLFVEDNRFKVGEIDNELVTEEFNESDFTKLTGSSKITDEKDYLEEVQIDESAEEDIVFSLPESIEDISELLQEEEEKIDREKKKFIDTGIEEEEIEIIEKEELPDKKKEVKQIQEVEEEPLKELEEEKERIKDEIVREIISEEISKEEKETVEEPESTVKEVEKEESSLVSKEKEETEETPTEHKASGVYINYEAELIMRNESLKDGLNKILASVAGGEESGEKIENTAEEIIRNCNYMEEQSRRMSFDIIASLYEAIEITLRSAIADELELDKESIQLLINAVLLIESLIKGYDYEHYEKVIKGLEEIRKSISEKKQEKRKLEELKEKKIEIEERISSEFEDETSREQLIKLKHNILELENTFNSLKSIKGEYQVYEALRRLSGIYPHLKEIVNVSKQLKKEKIAQISEASYIFVKFLQNYRLDPFDDDIQEIFRYIIYNFKLIFLDKPTKELDLLISYLNDPVKIFEQTKTKGKK